MKKVFAYSTLALFAVILMVPASSGAGETRIQSHDGIDGWECWTNSPHNCNGINKYPISVSKTSEDGQPSPSLLISGDPSKNTRACAEKQLLLIGIFKKSLYHLILKVQSINTSFQLPQ